jgi:hypothetical protein
MQLLSRQWCVGYQFVMALSSTTTCMSDVIEVLTAM